MKERSYEWEYRRIMRLLKIEGLILEKDEATKKEAGEDELIQVTRRDYKDGEVIEEWILRDDIALKYRIIVHNFNRTEVYFYEDYKHEKPIVICNLEEVNVHGKK